MNKTRLLKRSRFSYNQDSNGDIGDEMKWFIRISTFLCAALLLTGCSGPSMNTTISATEAEETAETISGSTGFLSRADTGAGH